MNKEFDKNEWDDEEGSGQAGEGQGGAAGKIHFRYRDAMSLPPRDDVLPPNEIKRLLQVHETLHKSRVDKQRQTRKERDALKQNKNNLTQQRGYGQGLGPSSGSQFKQHPISLKAYFSGIDKQMVSVPTELEADTNPEMQEKLENRFRLTHSPRHKLRPAGL